MNIFSFGNKKLPKTTAIFNLCSYRKCPSRKLGLCQLKNSKRCYALKAERMYKNTHLFRKRQEIFWDNCSVKEFIEKFKRETKGKKIKHLRINESGDFKSQRSFNKMVKVADKLKINTYVYTARRDLNFSKRKKLVVNGSNFMVDNKFTVIKDISKTPKDSKICKMNCRICSLCTRKGNKNICIRMH